MLFSSLIKIDLLLFNYLGLFKAEPSKETGSPGRLNIGAFGLDSGGDADSMPFVVSTINAEFLTLYSSAKRKIIQTKRKSYDKKIHTILKCYIYITMKYR